MVIIKKNNKIDLERKRLEWQEKVDRDDCPESNNKWFSESESEFRRQSREMSSLQVPELRLPANDGSGGGGGGGGGGSATGTGHNTVKGLVPLLLVPPSSIPRRRHSWICGWVLIKETCDDSFFF